MPVVMNGVCKLQIISLLVLFSFLSFGISVLLLLASGSWLNHTDREEVHIMYQQLQSPPENLVYYDSTINNSNNVVPKIRHKRHSRKTIRTLHHNNTSVNEHQNNKIQLVPLTNQLKVVPAAGQSHPITTHDLCLDPASLCTHYLPLEQQSAYKDCAARTMVKLEGLYKCNCQFMNTRGHRHVALVSLPGSGNTWLRGLIERASGVCTGSLFCDKVLHGGGMCGEGLRDGVVVIKTHDTKLQWTNISYKEGKWSDKRPFFDAVIVLVRSPFKALIAEWNRQNAYKFSSQQPGSSHVKYLQSSEYFLDNKRWNDFVMEELRKWKMIISENILKNKHHPVIVVFYEHLKSNHSISEVERVLDFLQFPHTTEQVILAVETGFSSYYRNHTDTFQHFTDQQRDSVNNAISETVNRLKSHNFTDIANHLDTYQNYDG